VFPLARSAVRFGSPRLLPYASFCVLQSCFHAEAAAAGGGGEGGGRRNTKADTEGRTWATQRASADLRAFSKRVNEILQEFKIRAVRRQSHQRTRLFAQSYRAIIKQETHARLRCRINLLLTADHFINKFDEWLVIAADV